MNRRSTGDDSACEDVEFSDTIIYAAVASLLGLVLGYLLRPGIAALAREVRAGDAETIPLLSAAAGWYLDSPGNPLIVALILALLTPAVSLVVRRLRNTVGR